MLETVEYERRSATYVAAKETMLEFATWTEVKCKSFLIMSDRSGGNAYLQGEIGISYGVN